MINARKLKKLISDLKHKDPSRRRNAAQELAEADERAVYPLINALGDQNPGVQDAAINSLVAIGGEVTAYMVMPLLRRDPFMRNTALLILRDLGSVTIPLLYPLLKDKDDDIRKFALDLMSEIKEGVVPEFILTVADDPNANVRAAAVQAIGALRYAGGLPIVIRALQDEEWVAFTALEVLGSFGDESSVDAIAKALKSSSSALRIAALDTLGALASERARKVLMDFIGEASGEEKATAMKSLVKTGVSPSMAGAGDLLLQMFREAGWEDKLIALRGLVDIHECRAIPLIIDVAGALDVSEPEDEEKMPAVMNALRQFGCCPELVAVLRDDKIRFKGKMLAADVLGDLKCADAIESLIWLYRNGHRDEQRSCINALGKMDYPEAWECIVEALDNSDGHIRKTAAMHLGFSNAPKAFEVIIGHLGREEFPDVMEEMVKALLHLDPKELFRSLDGFSAEVKEAVGRFAQEVDILLGLSRDDDVNVRISAISSLGEACDERARKRLVEASRDSSSDVRRAAVMALGSGTGTVEDIRPLLDDSDMWVRLHAVRLLGQSMKEDMLQALTPMLHDSDPPVVMATIEAIASIGGKEAFRVLHSLEHHKDEIIRTAVAEALARL